MKSRHSRWTCHQYLLPALALFLMSVNALPVARAGEEPPPEPPPTEEKAKPEGEKPVEVAFEPVPDVEGVVGAELKFELKLKPPVGEANYAIDGVTKAGKATAALKGMSLDAKSGAFLWKPSPSQAGEYSIECSASVGEKKTNVSVKARVKARGITGARGKIAELLKKWYAEGSAAGNTGDFYDNRCGGHSMLNMRLFPQLDRVIYTAEDRKKRRHWALQTKTLPLVVFGNSSTSASPTRTGSNIRSCYLHPKGLELLYAHFTKSNIYVYPEHRDHDRGHNQRVGFGDLYPTNTAGLIASQGSSGSDKVFLRAIGYTLAAFQPDVKKKLIGSGLLMPTVQMIFRISNKNIGGPEKYLTGAAHPSAFNGKNLDPVKMIELAHAITVKDIPPEAKIKVVREDDSKAGVDFFEPGRTEKMARETPAVIARVMRATRFEWRMTVSAEDSRDINGRQLKYHWVVLRGDASRIKITPRNESGSVAELVVPYHARAPIAPSSSMYSNRVDIGVFVHNGVHYSAPAFVTFCSLDNEIRTYGTNGRLLEIGYDGGDTSIGYHGAGDRICDGKSYDVRDWPGLLEMLDGEPETLGAKLLQSRIGDEEQKAILEAAKELDEVLGKLKTAQAEYDTVRKKHGKARSALKEADKKLKAAQEAQKKTQDETTSEAVKAATSAREEAKKKADRAGKELRAADKVLRAARGSALTVLTKKREGLDGGVKRCVEIALNRIRSDCEIYLKHREAIDDLWRKHKDAKVRESWESAIRGLIKLGVLKKDEKGDYHHSPIRGGDAPPAERLTEYEKNRLERLNLRLINQLFSGRVSRGFRINYVDARLTTPKAWRDVYRYGVKGPRTGWTRYRTGADPQEFTSDGLLVLKKDERGRPVRARAVRYVLVRKKWKPAWIEQKPTESVFQISYASDEELIGKAEPVAEEAKEPASAQEVGKDEIEQKAKD